jgi:hypothetical protein
MIEPTLRPASLDDAALAADLTTAAYPEFEQDPIITRYRWEHPRNGWSTGRFIAEISTQPIAFVDWIHGPADEDPERHCEVGVALDHGQQDPEVLTYLWRWVSDQAVAAGSRMLEAYAAEDQVDVLEALKRVGFEPDRLEKIWELDLGIHGRRLVAQAESARAQAASDGYGLTTVAAWNHPRKFETLHALDSRTRKDVPSTFPILPEAFENFMERFRSPDRSPGRWWIALRGDEPVAMSYLRFPPVRGRVWTGYTCCHPNHRGRGIARAVKLQTLAQAVELGIPFVYT